MNECTCQKERRLSIFNFLYKKCAALRTQHSTFCKNRLFVPGIIEAQVLL